MFTIFPSPICLLSESEQEFIVSTLATTGPMRDSLTGMLSDPEAMDIILDDKALYEARLGNLEAVHAKSQLDFYLLLRPVLQRAGVDDPELTRFLAALLSRHAYVERKPSLVPSELFKAENLNKLRKSLESKSSEGCFMALSFLGNYALLLSGLYPERLSAAAEGAPTLATCDAFGMATYLAAAQQPLAWEFGVDSIYGRLSVHFRQVRMALNELSEHDIFEWSPAGPPSLQPELFENQHDNL